MVLERSDGTSSLAASLSSAVELLEDLIDGATSNGVHWGTWSVLDAWIWTQHRPDGGSGGCPLDLGVPGLRLAGVVHPSFGYPRLS
jgi:hypothetical protein